MKKYILTEQMLHEACERSDRGEPEPPLARPHGSRCPRCGRTLDPDGICPAYGCLEVVAAQWENITLEQAQVLEQLWHGTTQEARDMVPEIIRKRVEAVLGHKLTIS